MAGSSSVRAGSAYVELSLNDSELLKGLRRAQSNLKSFSVSVNAVGKELATLGVAMTTPLALASKTFSSFDDALRGLSVTTGATDAEMLLLSQTAKELGASTQYTARQAVQAMTVLSKLGYSVDELNGSLRIFADLDTATGVGDLARTAELAGGALSAFGKGADEASFGVDILAEASLHSNQSLEDLSEALKSAGPFARSANADFRETTALLMALSQAGIKGSTAGQTLAKMFQRLSSGTGIEALNKLGVATRDISGNLRPLSDIIRDISSGLSGLSGADQLSILGEIFDTRSMRGASALLGSISQLDAYIQGLDASAGASRRVAGIMESGIGGAMRGLSSSISAVGLELGEIVSRYIKPYIEAMSGSLQWLAKWVASNEELVKSLVKFGGILLGAGTALLGLGASLKLASVSVGGLVMALKGIVGAVSLGVNSVKLLSVGLQQLLGYMLAFAPEVMIFTALGVTVGVAFVAIQKLTGAFDGLLSSLGTLGSSFVKAFRKITGIVSESMGVILESLRLGDVTGAVKVGLAGIRYAWESGLQPLRKLWGELETYLLDAWSICSFELLRGVSVLGIGLQSGFLKAGNAIMTYWSDLWGGIIDAFDDAIDRLRRSWVELRGIFSSTEDRDKALSEIDAKASERRQTRESQRANSRQDRVNRIESLSDRREEIEGIISQAEAEAISKHRKALDKSLGDAARSVEDAREEWQEAIEAQRRKNGTGREELSTSRAVEVREAVTPGLEQSQMELSKTMASFNARDFAGLFDVRSEKDEVALRTANATERNEKYLKEISSKISNISSGSSWAIS